MSILHAIILGIVQGLTEFLPVSSSGHLILLPYFFSWQDQGLLFDVVLHLGTLVAVVLYFYKKLIAIIRGFFSSLLRQADETGKKNGKFAWLLIISIIPAGIVGVLFSDSIETILRSPYVVVVSLILWAMVLYIADRWGDKMRNLEMSSWKDAIFIGCAQAIALIPGTSRSGITMTAGLFRGMTKQASAEFSFLMSVPIIFLAGVLKLGTAWREGFTDISIVVLSIGFITSMLSGLLAIKLLMKIIKTWSFKPFVLYRILLAIAVLIVLL